MGQLPFAMVTMRRRLEKQEIRFAAFFDESRLSSKGSKATGRQRALGKDVAMCSLSSQKRTLSRDIPTNEKENDILMSRDAYYLRQCKY